MNNLIKSIFRIDSYYNSLTFEAMHSNVYYQTFFQLHLDSLQILLTSDNPDVAALYQPHFDSFLGYLNIYKDYSFNSPEFHIEQKISRMWDNREFIAIMRDFYSSATPEHIIHFLGRVYLSELRDIKLSSWKFGKYPAHYTEATMVKSMLIHRVNFLEGWTVFQRFHKTFRKLYADGITKQGTHKIPKKKDIYQLIILHPYIPDFWLDLARLSKKDSEIITFLRIALCLDQTRYDIWKELIKFDPLYPKTNIPQLDDELNAIIRNKITQASKQKEVDGLVNQAESLIKRHNTFNELSQVMGSETATTSGQPTGKPSSNVPHYFECLSGVPGINHIELFNRIERAIAALPSKDLAAIQSLEAATQGAFNTSNLDVALELLLSIVHLSVQVGAVKNQTVALCNLGIYFSNAKRYTIARKYATDAKTIATQNNFLEQKLQALKVLGLIQTNDSKDPRARISLMEETAEVLRQLGRDKERKQILAQLESFKAFVNLLDEK